MWNRFPFRAYRETVDGWSSGEVSADLLESAVGFYFWSLLTTWLVISAVIAFVMSLLTRDATVAAPRVILLGALLFWGGGFGLLVPFAFALLPAAIINRRDEQSRSRRGDSTNRTVRPWIHWVFVNDGKMLVIATVVGAFTWIGAYAIAAKIH